MTPAEIRAAINASPELTALVPDTVALAAALSAGRTKLGSVSRELFAAWAAGNGMRAVIDDTAATVGHPLRSIALACKDVLAGAAEGIDFSKPQNAQMLQAWVQAGIMQQSDADSLYALATAPDPVDEMDVRRAIFNDDGSSAL